MTTNKTGAHTACPRCKGSGIGDYFDHGSAQHGEEAIEPIRCDDCDGFGHVDAPATGGTP